MERGMESMSTGSASSSVASTEECDENLCMDPPFEAFICPLTKQVMKDPVNLVNGQIFEREAVETWFQECENNGRKPTCPLTTQELQSTRVVPNIALQKTIKEWNLRNELNKLIHYCKLISSESSVHDIMQTLGFIEHIYKKGRSHKNVVRKADVIPMIIGLLTNGSRSVRCRALELLCMLTEDDRNKEALVHGNTVRTIIKFLNQDNPQEREQGAKLLHVLSKSEILSEKIGEINGAILILIGLASSATENKLTMQEAELTLENLEKITNNVLRMAENGRLEPLLRLFMAGSLETRFSMASHLGDLVLSNEGKVLVAQTIGASLVNILGGDNMLGKEVALKALKAISSYESSAKLLISSGILPPLIEGLFATGNRQLPMRLKNFSATILADLAASGTNFESIIVETNSSKTLVSEDILHNLLHLISNSNPSVGSKLLRVLVELTNSPTAVEYVVVSIKSSGATISLIQFIEVPTTDVSLEALKVLRNVSPFMSRELAAALCRSDGLSKLLEIVSEGDAVSEEQAVAVGLLADLPDADYGLVESFLNDGAFHFLIAKLLQVHQGKILGGRLATLYFEGLVLVVSKITYVLEYFPAMEFARNNDLLALFANLLQKNGFEKVQVASAKALRNLSHQTSHISQVPNPKPCLCPFFFTKKPTTELCKVHGGICSLEGTFCLVNEGVVYKLVDCLDHVNEEIVEAALEALCTLLEDGLDIKNGGLALANAKGISPIVKILINKRTGRIHLQAVWAIERLLRTEEIARQITTNPKVATVLIDAYRLGDNETKQIAEKALKWIDVLPPISKIFR